MFNQAKTFTLAIIMDPDFILRLKMYAVLLST